MFPFSGQILIFSIYRQTFAPILLAYMNRDFQCRYYLSHFFAGICCSQFFGRHWLFLFYSNMLIVSTPSGYVKCSHFLRLYYLFRLSRQTLIFCIFWATIKSSHFLQIPEIFNVSFFCQILIIHMFSTDINCPLFFIHSEPSLQWASIDACRAIWRFSYAHIHLWEK